MPLEHRRNMLLFQGCLAADQSTRSPHCQKPSSNMTPRSRATTGAQFCHLEVTWDVMISRKCVIGVYLTRMPLVSLPALFRLDDEASIPTVGHRGEPWRLATRCHCGCRSVVENERDRIPLRVVRATYGRKLKKLTSRDRRVLDQCKMRLPKFSSLQLPQRMEYVSPCPRNHFHQKSIAVPV